MNIQKLNKTESGAILKVAGDKYMFLGITATNKILLYKDTLLYKPISFVSCATVIHKTNPRK